MRFLLFKLNRGLSSSGNCTRMTGTLIWNGSGPIYVPRYPGRLLRSEHELIAAGRPVVHASDVVKECLDLAFIEEQMALDRMVESRGILSTCD